MNTEQQLQSIKHMLAAFITGIQQSGIIEGVQPQPQQDDLKLVVERLVLLEGAVMQMGERTKKLEQALEAHPQNLYTKEEMLKYLREEGMGGGLTKEEVMTTVMDDPKLSKLIQDVVTEEIEPRLNDYDERAKEIAEEVFNDADPFEHVRPGSKVWRHMEEAVDRVLDDKDFEDVTERALRNMDLHDHLDDSRLVDAVMDNIDIDDKVQDAINEYDFSEALRNTLSDEEVAKSVVKLVLVALSKRLTPEEE